MLWERKIHLEREMQQALDPSVGDLETTAMKKEIHRMSEKGKDHVFDLECDKPFGLRCIFGCQSPQL